MWLRLHHNLLNQLQRPEGPLPPGLSAPGGRRRVGQALPHSAALPAGTDA
ncbi:hypothetical protein [Deinococcus radiophilus]|nr:hypothetical protein [Deinococcus radiophilus]